ncbi:cysteine hydrolase family protein [Streptomyces sp. NPDC002144]
MTGTPETPLMLDPGTTAILNIHHQRDILSTDVPAGVFFGKAANRQQFVKNTARVLDLAREHGAMVAYVRAAFRPGHPELIPNSPMFQALRAARALQEGTPGAEIIPDLAPQAEEPVVTHTRLSGFQGTALDLMLRARGIVNVVVTGVATNLAVESTARDAVERGYRTVLVADACAAVAAAHNATLATFQLLGWTLNSTDLAAAFDRD